MVFQWAAVGGGEGWREGLIRECGGMKKGGAD